MKKHLAMLCAAMMCVCCLGLAACGGSTTSSAASASGSASSAAASDSASAASASASGSASSAAASDSASAASASAASTSASAASASASSASASASSASASSASAASTSPFVGTWKIAAAETEGITMAGDLSMFLDGVDEAGLVINSDGTGSMTFEGETVELTWAETGDKAIALTVNDASVPVTAVDGALKLDMEDEEMAMSIYLTADGTYAGAKVIDLSSAKAITSEDALVGTWKVVGACMMGVSIYGDAESLAAITGEDDTVVTFEKGGKMMMGDDEMSWSVGADGAAIVDGSGSTDMNIPIKALGDDIVLDMSDLMGMEFAMVFSK